MNTKANVFRPSLTDIEIQSICYDIDTARTNGQTIDPHTSIAIGKLKTLLLKANLGVVKAAYSQTGRKPSMTITLEALEGLAPNAPIVDSPSYVGLERRNSDANVEHAISYTAEQIEEAKFKAADDFIATGIQKDWHEFLPVNKPNNIPTNKEIDNTDQQLFNAL